MPYADFFIVNNYKAVWNLFLRKGGKETHEGRLCKLGCCRPNLEPDYSVM